MKKDIVIPKSEGVQLAAIKEWNEDFGEDNWYAYLINSGEVSLEMVIVVSKSFGILNNEQKKTGVFRHVFPKIEAKQMQKIEWLENNLLALYNEFKITYFIGNTMYEKTFTFTPNSINDRAMEPISIDKNFRGVVLK